MGCDGGTIPTRDELVKTKKKPEQKDRNAELVFRWKHCALSQEKLSQPIVACQLGRLYNKESVLKQLIDKTDKSPMFRHLKAMKDVKQLTLTDNPAKITKRTGTGDGYVDCGVSDYICPVVGLEMSGKYRFCCLWSCGCVLSERAIKEVKSSVCHKCGKIYEEDHVISLNPVTEEEEKILEDRMIARRALAKANKKSKKAEATSQSVDQTTSNGTDMPVGGASSSSSSSTNSTSTTLDGATMMMPPPPSTVIPQSSSSDSTLQRPTTSTSTSSSSKVKDSKLKVKSSSSSSSSSSSVSQGQQSQASGIKQSSKRKSKPTIQEDPTTSKVFKSLFTTSEKAINQQQPHWVTYNPMYY